MKNGAFAAVVSDHWSIGGAGAVKLAEAVIEACNSKSSFKLLYELDLSIEEKALKIATEMYGATSIELAPKVKETIKLYNEKVLTSYYNQVLLSIAHFF